jgi:hypothetical protein
MTILTSQFEIILVFDNVIPVKTGIQFLEISKELDAGSSPA